MHACISEVQWDGFSGINCAYPSLAPPPMLHSPSNMIKACKSQAHMLGTRINDEVWVLAYIAVHQVFEKGLRERLN
jgi:hypothetical protein